MRNSGQPAPGCDIQRIVIEAVCVVSTLATLAAILYAAAVLYQVATGGL